MVFPSLLPAASVSFILRQLATCSFHCHCLDPVPITLHCVAMQKSQYIPFHAPIEVVELVEDAVAKTKLSTTEVMCQGLRGGIPQVVTRTHRPRRSLVAYLDKFGGLSLRPDKTPVGKSRFA